MNVVIDCNVLVSCLSGRSKTHGIYQGMLRRQYTLLVSNEIFLEYEEILQRKYGREATEVVLDLIIQLPSVRRVEVWYSWGLITADPDDNKYVDCYLAGKGEWLVTEDQHFASLARIAFPKVNVCNMQDFLTLLRL